MSQAEQEQVVNAIETKAGTVRNLVRQQRLDNDETVTDLLEMVDGAKQNGISFTEAKYLLDDLTELVSGAVA